METKVNKLTKVLAGTIILATVFVGGMPVPTTFAQDDCSQEWNTMLLAVSQPESFTAAALAYGDCREALGFEAGVASVSDNEPQAEASGDNPYAEVSWEDAQAFFEENRQGMECPEGDIEGLPYTEVIGNGHITVEFCQDGVIFAFYHATLFNNATSEKAWFDQRGWGGEDLFILAGDQILLGEVNASGVVDDTIVITGMDEYYFIYSID